MAKSKIEWTQETWNPIAGCNDVSEGCRNCYARGMAKRLEAMGQEKYRGLTVLQGSKTVWTGKISFDEKALMAPLAHKKPTTYFVNSMSDLFHPNVTDQMRDKIFAIIGMCPHHTFQILTKRPEVAYDYYESRSWGWAAKHFIELPGKSAAAEWVRRGMELAHLGTSTENQATFDMRLPYLAAIDVRYRFLSVEPMLGPITTRKIITPHKWVATSNAMAGIALVIVGGESGHNARPMHPGWVRTLRDEVLGAGTGFFFKQWGEWTPGENVERTSGIVKTASWFDGKWSYGVENLANDEGHRDDEPDLYRVGKKAAGHFLDGREYQTMPRMK